MKFFLTCLCWLSCVAVHATDEFDSLARLLQTPLEDTTKIKVQNQFALEMSAKDIDSSLAIIHISLMQAEQLKYAYGLVDAHVAYGMILIEKGDADKAMEHLLQALQVQETEHTTFSLAEIYRVIGFLFFTQKEYSESEKYLNEALKVAEPQKGEILRKVYFSLATLYSRTQRFDESEQFFQKILNSPHVTAYEKASVYLNKGNLYQRMKQLNKAEDSYQLALKFYKETDLRGLGKVYNSLTDVALKTGRYNLAEEYGKKGLSFAEATQNIRSAIYACRNLGYAYSLRNDYKNAYDIQYKERELRDSLTAQTNAQILNELEEKYQNEKKQRQIEQLQKEQELSKEREEAAQMRIYFGVAIGFLITVSLLLLMQLQRTRHKRDIRLRENQKQIQDFELREKEQQIRQYKDQLLRHTHNLLQKNQLLSELREELETLKDAESEHEQLKRKKIEELINSRILTDEDWHNYKNMFEQVYPQFFEKLEQQIPKITKAEQRIATLLKLRLSQYEMATILGISEESVRKGKYRLRQRMNVESEEEVQQFLDNVA